MVAGNVCLLLQLTVYFLCVMASLLRWPAGGRFPDSDLHLLHLPPQSGAWLAWPTFPPAASARSLIGATACTPCSSCCPNQQEEGIEGGGAYKSSSLCSGCCFVTGCLMLWVFRWFWELRVCRQPGFCCIFFVAPAWLAACSPPSNEATKCNNYRAALRVDVRQEGLNKCCSLVTLMQNKKQQQTLFILLQLFWQKSVELHKLEASLSSINVTQQPSFTLNLQEWNIQPELQTHCTISTAFPTMNCG